VDARRHIVEAEEKFAALIEWARKDDAKAERVWKEQDDLLQTMAGLHIKRELA
jgi:hypothetical protein